MKGGGCSLCVSPLLLANRLRDRGDLGNGFGFFPLSRSVVAVCMCAIKMRVVCFMTDFTDTGPYLHLYSCLVDSPLLRVPSGAGAFVVGVCVL